MSKKMVFLIFSAFSYLLLNPTAAVSSARDGLLLWYHSVLPVLFPFFFLNSLFIRTVNAEDLPRPLIRPLMRLFGCSASGAFVILAGFLCGFPMGAKLSADLYRQQKITREEAYRLTGFANNLSPGFILTYLATEQLKLSGQSGWFLFQILGAAFLSGLIEARVQAGHDRKTAKPYSEPQSIQAESEQQEPLSFAVADDCIYDSMGSILRLGAYILLFTILSGAMTQMLPLTNPVVLLAVSGIEVTNGIHLLAESALNAEFKYVAVSALAAFGGLSALAQSAGLGRMKREQFFYYIKSRVRITLLAVLLSAAVLSLN